MAVSKALEKLEAGQLSDPEMGYRDRINAYFRSRGKTAMSKSDREIFDRSSEVQEILMANRTDIPAAKKKIKEKFKLTHREEVDRYIEDAKFLMGASFVIDRTYQRMIQHQDIEYWLQLAKTNGDGDLAEKMLLRREKLYQLDQPDQISEFNNFNILVINAEVKYFIDANDLKEAEKMRRSAMKELGLVDDIEEINDAEFSN